MNPIKYGVKNLPVGLQVNGTTGVISGIISSKEEKEYNVTLIVENAVGKAEKDLKIKVGEEICLTPPLGWNRNNFV